MPKPLMIELTDFVNDLRLQSSFVIANAKLGLVI